MLVGVDVGRGEARGADALDLRRELATQVGGVDAAGRHAGQEHPPRRRQPAALSTSVGISRALSSGGSSPTAARWAPTPMPAVSRSHAAEGSNPGASARADVLVTMPSAWARRIARDTAGVSP